MRSLSLACTLVAAFLVAWAVTGAGSPLEDPPILAIAAIRSGVSQILVVDATGKIIGEPTYSAGAQTPTWSPDGKRIVFCSGDPPHIFVMNSDGSDPVKLTDTASGEHAPCWSPDGKKIAFFSQPAGNADIFVIDPHGSNLVNLTNHEAWDSDPAWSPDSKQIAFLSSRAGRLRLHVMNTDGSDVRELLNRDQSGWTFPAWSPDGKQILFTDRHDDGSWHVFVVNTDGKGLQKISDEAGYNVWPAWSPDGRYVTYVNYGGVPGKSGSEHGRLVMRDLIDETPTPPALAALQCGARPAWKPRSR